MQVAKAEAKPRLESTRPAEPKVTSGVPAAKRSRPSRLSIAEWVALWSVSTEPLSSTDFLLNLRGIATLTFVPRRSGPGLPHPVRVTCQGDVRYEDQANKMLDAGWA